MDVGRLQPPCRTKGRMNMTRTCVRLLTILALMGVLGAWSTAAGVQTQPAEPVSERFTCDTADGVKIVGEFYPDAKGKGERAPCVVLLHPVGPARNSSSRADFGRLPQLLQQEGFAVVVFDFRGHGESVEIDMPRYYDLYPPARANPNQPLPNRIDNRDFRQIAEWVRMTNDLTAVKVWLNKQNNLKKCNSHNVALVGVEQSTLLGLMFAVNEHRDPNRALDFAGQRMDQELRLEGEDLVSAVWLTPTDRLGGERIDPTVFQAGLQFLQARRLNLMAAFGEDDQAARDLWNRTQTSLRTRERDAERGALVRRIKGTSLGGLRLLEHPTFGVQKEMVQFLTDTLQTPNMPWSEHRGNQHPSLVNAARIFGAP